MKHKQYFTSYGEVLSAFHSELACHAERRNKTVCIILYNQGGLIKTEYWERQETK